MIKLTLAAVSNTFSDGLVVLKNSEITKVVGRIEHKNERTNLVLLGVKDFDGSDMTEDSVIYIGSQLNGHWPTRDNFTVSELGMINSDAELTPMSYIAKMIKVLDPMSENRAVVMVDDKSFDTYNRYLSVAQQLRALYSAYPVYEHIVTYEDGKPSIHTLVDIIFSMTPELRDDLLLAFSYSNGHIRTLRGLAERVLDRADIEEGQDLMTQEQQVESFIGFSKLVAKNTHEIVTDETLDTIKNSVEYQTATQKMEQEGFGLSKTQQFNSLQASAYLASGRNHIIYNLSDMGAGKTLMTVESIFLMDMHSIIAMSDETNKGVEDAFELWLPSKNLIAPKLSVKSSWVKTFGIFYDVEEISKSQYKLSFDHDGVTYSSYLNVSAFTVRTASTIVDDKIPEAIGRADEYLIIDEIHQLVGRKISRGRFFESATTTPYSQYKSFILSGTLSNLTTTEWLNYVNFMGTPVGYRVLDSGTPSQQESHQSAKRETLSRNIREAAENIGVNQRRVFDPDTLVGEQSDYHNNFGTSKMSQLFHTMYSSKLLALTTPDESVGYALSQGQYRIIRDETISDTPNFELFYQLVGSHAITAQSTQVAEELFGEQKTQHNAEVINVPSSLTNNDIEILRVLHAVTNDYKIYKSQAIATAINNAILNLNDGLAKKNVYEIISRYANSNSRFLSYLATLDLNLLETLPQSGMIKQPELKETRKFKILKNILADEKDETHLIVVNDADAMLKLASALEIDSITKKQLRDPLNYQEVIDALFEKQSVVIVPQAMIKSSLDLVQANRLIQYQLNSEISDIIQTQNRINRIGQTRETKAYYIATDVLQKNVIDLFLETYKNIRVAHRGIVELFVDMNSQVNVVNDYIGKAIKNIGNQDAVEDAVEAEDEDEIELAPAALKMDIKTEFQFNKDGQMELFDDMPEPEVEPAIEEDSDIVVLQDYNPAQMNLFEPDVLASNHQLVLDI